MVSKCANPDCSTRYRYFHTGKLFRLQRPPIHSQGPTPSDPTTHASRLEFFWLCDACADKLTIGFDNGAVSVRPKLSHIATAA